MGHKNRMRDPGEHLRTDVDAIKSDLQLLRGDVAAALRGLIDVGRAGVGDARARLEEAVHSGFDVAAGGMAYQGRRAVDSAQRYVVSNPMRSVAMVFGAGLLLGLGIGALVGSAVDRRMR